MTQHRGSAYVAVLGASMLVAVIGIAALTVVRADRVEAQADEDIAQARANAIAAAELAANWIDTTPAFRSSYAGMRSNTGLLNTGGFAMPMGTASIELVDNSDGVLDNRDYDLVLVRAIGRAGNAQQMFDVSLQPVGIPLPILSNALTVRKRVLVSSGQLEVIDAPVMADSFSGSITGTQVSYTAAVEMPNNSVVSQYAGMGVALPSTGTIDRRVLAPLFSSYGTTSTDGVYVLTATSDVTISNMRLVGTLIVRAPGRRVRVTGQVFMVPARADYPTLIVDCQVLELDYDSAFDGTIAALAELAESTNFNPPGAPWVGTTNTSNFDVYPSEIRGLVFATGRIEANAHSLIRGTLISNEPAGNAVVVAGRLRIVHDDALVTSPPMWFTSGVEMNVVPGSWRQRTN
jgi:hypothetical protein